jgi:hypothetical protein
VIDVIMAYRNTRSNAYALARTRKTLESSDGFMNKPHVNSTSITRSGTPIKPVKHQAHSSGYTTDALIKEVLHRPCVVISTKEQKAEFSLAFMTYLEDNQSQGDLRSFINHRPRFRNVDIRNAANWIRAYPEGVIPSHKNRYITDEDVAELVEMCLFLRSDEQRKRVVDATIDAMLQQRWKKNRYEWKTPGIVFKPMGEDTVRKYRKLVIKRADIAYRVHTQRSNEQRINAETDIRSYIDWCSFIINVTMLPKDDLQCVKGKRGTVFLDLLLNTDASALLYDKDLFSTLLGTYHPKEDRSVSIAEPASLPFRQHLITSITYTGESRHILAIKVTPGSLKSTDKKYVEIKVPNHGDFKVMLIEGGYTEEFFKEVVRVHVLCLWFSSDCFLCYNILCLSFVDGGSNLRFY